MELYRERLSIIPSIPVLNRKALYYVFEENLVNENGMWMEFGTYDGRSLNKIALETDKTVFGFDSFEGLPEDWTGRILNGQLECPQGTFNLNGQTDFFIFPNVVLVKGWFRDTLPSFLKEQNRGISFMHVDGDIYSSAVDVLENCSAYIQDGCVIVFDELLGYSNFEEHEWKAWWEFVENHNIEFEWIGGNIGGSEISSFRHREFGEGAPSFGWEASPSYENAAVCIVRNPSLEVR